MASWKCQEMLSMTASKIKYGSGDPDIQYQFFGVCVCLQIWRSQNKIETGPSVTSHGDNHTNFRVKCSLNVTYDTQFYHVCEFIHGNHKFLTKFICLFLLFLLLFVYILFVRK